MTEETERKKRRPASHGAAVPVLIVGEQPLEDVDKHLLSEAYERLDVWADQCKAYHREATVGRMVYRLQDPDQDTPGTPEAEATLQLQTLKSTINGCIADQMDNTQEARMIPERPELQDVADDLTDVVRFVLDQNCYEEFHRRRVEDFFIAGTAVTQVVWDDDMDNGHGNIAVVRYPIEGIVWDPMAEDIDDARAIIKLSWHPLSWYAEHYPNQAKYVVDETHDHDDVGVPDSNRVDMAREEGKAMLMEYWYRRYDAGKNRYTINVAYIAGNALLDKYEDVYAHGRYPFVFDPFTRIEGQPVGEGMVKELTPMMRYINRYAHYIDVNLRYSSKMRMLARRGSGINLEHLANCDRDIVEGDNISDEDVRWMESKPLNGMATNQMLQFQSDMKQDSGQNQFSRGETTGGVSAASAISALQEAGGKVTRMRTQQLSFGFKKIVELIMWLIAEKYDSKRSRMIVGRDDKPREVELNSRYLMGNKGGDSFPPPPYTVQVQIQRRNPMRVQAQNDLIIQAYSMAAQAGQNFPLSVLFEMLNVDGKEKLMPVLQQLDQHQQMMQQMMAQNQQLQAENENMRTSLEQYESQMLSDNSDLMEASFGETENSPI